VKDLFNISSRAFACQAVLSIGFVRNSSPFPATVNLFLPFAAYPLAGYYIVKRDRQVSSTATMRVAANDLFQLVEAGEILEDDDVQCFSSDTWNQVPWHQVSWSRMDQDLR
jgi:hypothetical protein